MCTEDTSQRACVLTATQPKRRKKRRSSASTPLKSFMPEAYAEAATESSGLSGFTPISKEKTKEISRILENETRRQKLRIF